MMMMMMMSMIRMMMIKLYHNEDDLIIKKYLELLDCLLQTLPTEQSAPASELSVTNPTKSA